MTIKVKRHFLILIFLCLLNNITIAQTVVTQIPDRLAPANSVLMTGFIAEKLDEAYNNRILTQDVDRLIEPFKNRTEDKCWQSEFWGKWFTSAVQAYKYKPEPELKKRPDIAVLKLLSTQTPDGYIGNYAEDKHLDPRYLNRIRPVSFC